MGHRINGIQEADGSIPFSSTTSFRKLGGKMGVGTIWELIRLAALALLVACSSGDGVPDACVTGETIEGCLDGCACFSHCVNGAFTACDKGPPGTCAVGHLDCRPDGGPILAAHEPPGGGNRPSDLRAQAAGHDHP